MVRERTSFRESLFDRQNRRSVERIYLNDVKSAWNLRPHIMDDSVKIQEQAIKLLNGLFEYHSSKESSDYQRFSSETRWRMTSKTRPNSPFVSNFPSTLWTISNNAAIRQNWPGEYYSVLVFQYFYNLLGNNFGFFKKKIVMVAINVYDVRGFLEKGRIKKRRGLRTWQLASRMKLITKCRVKKWRTRSLGDIPDPPKWKRIRRRFSWSIGEWSFSTWYSTTHWSISVEKDW